MSAHKQHGCLKVAVALSNERIGFIVVGELMSGVLKVGTYLHHPSGESFKVCGVEIMDVDRSEGVAFSAAILGLEEVTKAKLDVPGEWVDQQISFEYEVGKDLEKPG